MAKSRGAVDSLLQDWHLKRRKYGRRNVGSDSCADWLIDFVEAFVDRRG